MPNFGGSKAYTFDRTGGDEVYTGKCMNEFMNWLGVNPTSVGLGFTSNATIRQPKRHTAL